MTREDYFYNRLLKDVIDHCILVAEEPTSDNLYLELKALWSNYFSMQFEKAEDCIKAFVEERLKRDLYDRSGKPVSELPESININNIEDIKNELKEKIESIFSYAQDSEIKEKMLECAEQKAWLNGLNHTASAFESALLRLQSKSNMLQAPSFKGVADAHLRAQEVTFKERLTGSNYKDVLEYVDELSNYLQLWGTTVFCHIFNAHKVLVLESPEIQLALGQMMTTIKQALEYPLDVPNDQSAWEDDYQKKFPVKFFHRNLPNISGNFAFTMMFLRTLASNESWLRQQGFINGAGEFRLFTHPTANGSAFDEILKILRIYLGK